MNLNGVEFNDPQWHENTLPAVQNERVWTNDIGDTILLRYIDLPPDIPAPLSNLDAIWRLTRIKAFWSQAAPISVTVDAIDGIPALHTITKFHRYNGNLYQASIIVPFRDFSFVIIIQSVPTGGDQEREAAALKNSRSVPLDQSQDWYVDPFGFKFVAPIGLNVSEDECWDSAFPNHALSRLRQYIKRVGELVRISDDYKSQPLFEGPDDLLDIEREIKVFTDVFTITEREQVDAVVFGRQLTERVERLLSRCSQPTRTALLTAEDKIKPAFELSREISEKAQSSPDDKICLLLYSGNVDTNALAGMRAMAAFYAQRDKDMSELEQPDDMASQNFRHWEFLFSRLMATMGFRAVAIRRDDFAYQQFGVSLIEADGDDWFAKMMVLAELADVIFCAPLFNQNLGKEFGYVFHNPKLRQKFIFRSSRQTFLLADEQDYSWPVNRLAELGMYVSMKSRGFPVSISRSPR
jgi:hypothetical protein